MSFVVPETPVRGSQGSRKDDEGSDNNNQPTPESKGVFVIPTTPVKKSSAMPPPPPPPVFSKEQAPSSKAHTVTSDPDDAPRSTSTSVSERTASEKDSKPSAPNAPPLKYHKPAWSGYPNQQFYFEVIKNGVVMETIQAPEKEFLVIGRLPMCDLEMEHPVTHGTKLNKTKIPPGMHVSLKPGDQLRFGESSRIYLFQTEQAEDQEEEERKLVAAMIARQNKAQPVQSKDEDDQGCNWGMQEDAEDAEDEDDMDEAITDGSVRRTIDPDAYYRKDPKKALRNYLENKGYSCEFEVEEEGPGHAREYTARIRLPIETAMGPVYGQATTGKKRDAEREAALDACIQLDSRGMLGQKSTGEVSTQARSKKFQHSDDDDEDDFYDRTVKKKSSVKKTEQKALSHEELLEKHRSLSAEMNVLEKKVQDYDTSAAEKKNLEESGDLDAFMASLEKSGGDSKAKLQQNLASMKKEEKRLLQLIEYTKPMDILAKIGGGSGGAVPKSSSSNATSVQTSLESEHSKRQHEPDTPAEPDNKKARVIGPSLPPST
ncbi:Kanadaptin [Mortierella polycephala]|uniref:Kanadaptin n=1 Tax=Mortierella polycephala TaxID=41804 RepID=A0A9P6QDL8_9FUNG|nr:Kanadaptin [Mortierella polycephala]